MIGHFNRLTPAEAERLAMLAEECGEVIQIIDKILRHGYASCHPITGENNCFLLIREISDVMAVIDVMTRHGDIRPIIGKEVANAWAKKLRFSHHQNEGYNPGMDLEYGARWLGND